MKIKCNFSADSVDLQELTQYGSKPPESSDVFKEAVFKKSGTHKGDGKPSRSDQLRCFRLKNHFLFYYNQSSLPIVDKNLTGVIILINVYISKGLMSSSIVEHPFVLRVATNTTQQAKLKVYELRSKGPAQRDEWFTALQQVIQNAPVGASSDPSVQIPSPFRRTLADMNSSGFRAPESAKLKPPTICDQHFYSLTFDEMHANFMEKSTSCLRESAALKQWKSYFGQHRKSRRESSNQRKDSSSSQNDKSSSSNSTEQPSQEVSREFRTDSDLLEAFRKQKDFLIDISPVHQVPNLL